MEESWRNIDSFEAGDTSSDQEYNTWSFLGRVYTTRDFDLILGLQHLQSQEQKTYFSKQHASCSQKSSCSLTFLTNLAGMIFEHLEEKLVHCASLAVWTQYRDGGRTQWPRELLANSEKNKSWGREARAGLNPLLSRVTGYWIPKSEI